jgi:endoglucanase
MPSSKTHQLALVAPLVMLASLAGCGASPSSSEPAAGLEGGAAPSLDGGSSLGTTVPTTQDASSSLGDASSSPADASSPQDAGPPPPPVSSHGLSLKVSGNQLLDANSKPVRLLGVNRSGAEGKCIQGGTPPNSLGWDIYDSPTDLASAQAIVSWHANAVRLPLNEDCWFGINGVNPLYGGANYQKVIADYVATLHQAGLYVILDLHWNAPGNIPALDQQPMPDADHSVDFWKAVATRFASDPAVVFDLYNEPYVYSNYMQNPNGDPWQCWLNGCTLNTYVTGGTPYMQSLSWNAVGMQALVNAVRGTGAKNPIMVGGLGWANDLSGWLAHKPNDPQNALIASWHNYPNQNCTDSTCWNATIGPVAAQVPVVIGETGDAICSGTTLVDGELPWADAHGVSYLGWTWNAWQGYCEDVLITDYSGTPTANYGQKFHDLLAKSNP